MSTTSTAGITPPGMGLAGTSTQAATSAMGRDQFLKLLVTQLANQDPMSPMQGTEFVAQLATFSSLEQQMNISDRIQALALSQTAAVGAQAVSFVGKEILAAGGHFDLAEGHGAQKLDVFTGGKSASGTLTVLDDKGNVVATRELGPLDAGKNQVDFDGLDKSGNPLKAGSYSFRVDAKDGAGVAVEATALTRGIVKAVVYSGGAPTLRVGTREVTLGEVMEVSS